MKLLEDKTDLNKDGVYDEVASLQVLIGTFTPPIILSMGSLLIVLGALIEKPALIEAGHIFTFGGAYKMEGGRE